LSVDLSVCLSANCKTCQACCDIFPEALTAVTHHRADRVHLLYSHTRTLQANSNISPTLSLRNVSCLPTTWLDMATVLYFWGLQSCQFCNETASESAQLGDSTTAATPRQRLDHSSAVHHGIFDTRFDHTKLPSCTRSASRLGALTFQNRLGMASVFYEFAGGQPSVLSSYRHRRAHTASPHVSKLRHSRGAAARHGLPYSQSTAHPIHFSLTGLALPSPYGCVGYVLLV
jgi:hypothetical protein